MKLIVGLLLATMLFISNTITAQNKTITVTIANVTSDEGKVGFALYKDKTTFNMRKALQGKEGKIVDGKTTIIFEDVAPGEYAIVCFHDKNNNDKMDFAANGMPLEDYGASNNVMAFAPPTFEGAKFLLKDENLELEIKF
ncbi:MAG: DUF2141 domain-containing protein [Polaribacter sp.]